MKGASLEFGHVKPSRAGRESVHMQGASASGTAAYIKYVRIPDARSNAVDGQIIVPPLFQKPLVGSVGIGPVVVVAFSPERLIKGVETIQIFIKFMGCLCFRCYFSSNPIANMAVV